MNNPILLISLCIFSSASWSNCVGDCVNGQGTYTYANGDKYVGQWRNDLRNGQGTYTYANGEKYVGEYKDDKKNGQGTYTYPNGNRYVGQWKGGNQYQGSFIWRDGSKYVGQWRNGSRNGQGTSTYANGEKYVGEYKDDKKNGKGTYTYPNGNRYVGQFRDGYRLSGQGVDYLIDGRQLHFKSDGTELVAANGQMLRTNVQNNELDAIRLESVQNKRDADELASKQQRRQERGSDLRYQLQQEKEQKLRIEQRLNRGLIVGIQRQLIEYKYLSGIADGIAGRNTLSALERFYQDTRLIRPFMDDYTTISEDLDLNLMKADGTCSNNSANQSKYTVCFNIAR